MTETIPYLLKEALLSRFEGWELVDFLQIPIDRIVEHFENDILENMEDLEDFVGLRTDNDNNNDGDEYNE